MTRELAEALDQSIRMMQAGEKVGEYLADYPEVRSEIEPLLRMASSISAAPRIVPPRPFGIVSRARLVARIRREAVQADQAQPGQDSPLLDILGLAWRRLWQTGTAVRRTAIPVALATLLVIGAGVSGLRLLSPPPALASQCTLTVLSGSAEIQTVEDTVWREGSDGITLAVGTRVRTSAQSSALLTFFEGSTIKLEPETDVEIQQVESTPDQSTRIVLKQWLGRTWSRVVKMAGPGSHYEIQTPSATAVVRGTLFSTSVDEDGATEVATTDGLVSVVAQGEEVSLPPNQQTRVPAGSPPSLPQATPARQSELVVRTQMPSAASLCDPTGSSTGTLTTGLSFNQIAGSISSAPDKGAGEICVPEPAGGEYVLALRYWSPGTASFSIQALSGGVSVFEYSDSLEGTAEGGWLIRFNLQVEDGVITGGQVLGIEPLRTEAPEKTVDPAAMRAVPRSSQSASRAGNDEEGLDMEQGWQFGQAGDQDQQTDENGQDKDKGQSNGQGKLEQKDPGPASGQAIGKDKAPGQSSDKNQGKDSGQDKEAKKAKEKEVSDRDIRSFVEQFLDRVADD